MILYKVTNIVNGKAYVGITSRGLRARWSAHLRQAGKGKGWVLHAAIRQHGAAAFVVSELARFKTWEELATAEVGAIAQYHTHVSEGGYNLARGGEGAFGVKRRPESIAKLAAARAWYRPTPEQIAKAVATRKRNREAGLHKVVRLSAEHKKAIGDAQRGRPRPAEYREKIAAALRGRPGATKGRPLSLEARAKLSAALIGKKLSPERRAAMSRGQLLRHARLRAEAANAT